jgi:hypothetical protein
MNLLNSIDPLSDILFYKFIILSIVAGFVIIMIKMVDFNLIKEDFKIMTECSYLLKLYNYNEKFLSDKGIDLNKVRFSSCLGFAYDSDTDQIFTNKDTSMIDLGDDIKACFMMKLEDPDYSELKEQVNNSKKGFVFFLSMNLVDEVYCFNLDLILC